MLNVSFLPILLLLVASASSFQLSSPEIPSRRHLLNRLVLIGTGVATIPQQAVASGGATAGGAYLLSAKQRYNERVSKGVVAYLGLRSALDAGDTDTLRAFFASDDGWKDFSAAGYLLANAFRRSSTTPPDNLPSVQKWKAFAAKVEDMTKALKKKDSAKALAVFDSSMAALDEYLEKVELPPAKDISSSS